jgi:citrate lyase subunit beta/citryl-CoA lyase/(S)-citramalyl-CoA lyase
MNLYLDRRSMLCTPATAADWYTVSRRCGADVGLLDLEDSVPADRKTQARALARGYCGPDESASVPGVRVNSPAARDGLADLLAIGTWTHRPELVMVPKVESPRDIEITAAVLAHDGRAPQMWAVIETPRGIAELDSIARAPGLAGLVFGAADYTAATGAALRWPALAFARSAIVNAAGHRGLEAMDSPYFDIDDLAGLRRECRLARSFGFCGKVAVHPRQVPVINAAFTPTAYEIARAREVLAAAEDTGSAVTAVGGQMIGTPFFAAARAVAAYAQSTLATPDRPGR